MTHTLDSIDHHFEGDTIVLEFVIEDADAETDGARKDLTGATFEWKLVDKRFGETVLSSSNSDDISTSIIDAANGEFQVTVGSGATADLAGTYQEQLVVTDGNDNRNTFTAEFVITEP